MGGERSRCARGGIAGLAQRDARARGTDRARRSRPAAAAAAPRRRRRRSWTRSRRCTRRRRVSARRRRRDRRRRAAPSSARCGRSDWPTARRCRRRNAASNARATGCDGTRRPTLSWPPVTMSRDARRARQDQRQRSRPEGRGQLHRSLGYRARPARELRCVVQVDDHRMVGGAALGGEDPAHGVRIGRIGAEAVDGFGRERDEPAGAQVVDGASDGRRCRCVDAAGHRSRLSGSAPPRAALRPEGLSQRRVGPWVLLEFESLRAAHLSVALTVARSGNE